VLTRDRLIEGLKAGGPESPVAAAMLARPHTVPPTASLQEVAQQIQTSGCPVVPVVEYGRLRGLVTVENLGEVVVLRRAVPAWRSQSGNQVRVAAANPLPHP
jgi:Mg/Co/Ni transporter MgtE